MDPLLSGCARALRLAAAGAIVLLLTACHPGPVVDTGPKPPDTLGTIAGTVRADAGAVSLAGRKVVAVDEATGARFEATTGSNGGYTIQVPAGTYRLDVELHSGETLSSRPEVTKVDKGDIDAERNFVLTVATR